MKIFFKIQSKDIKEWFIGLKNILTNYFNYGIINSNWISDLFILPLSSVSDSSSEAIVDKRLFQLLERINYLIIRKIIIEYLQFYLNYKKIYFLIVKKKVFFKN